MAQPLLENADSDQNNNENTILDVVRAYSGLKIMSNERFLQYLGIQTLNDVEDLLHIAPTQWESLGIGRVMVEGIFNAFDRYNFYASGFRREEKPERSGDIHADDHDEKEFDAGDEIPIRKRKNQATEPESSSSSSSDEKAPGPFAFSPSHIDAAARLFGFENDVIDEEQFFNYFRSRTLGAYGLRNRKPCMAMLPYIFELYADKDGEFSLVSLNSFLIEENRGYSSTVHSCIDLSRQIVADELGVALQSPVDFDSLSVSTVVSANDVQQLPMPAKPGYGINFRKVVTDLQNKRTEWTLEKAANSFLQIQSFMDYWPDLSCIDVDTDDVVDVLLDWISDGVKRKALEPRASSSILSMVVVLDKCVKMSLQFDPNRVFDVCILIIQTRNSPLSYNLAEDILRFLLSNSQLNLTRRMRVILEQPLQKKRESLSLVAFFRELLVTKIDDILRSGANFSSLIETMSTDSFQEFVDTGLRHWDSRVRSEMKMTLADGMSLRNRKYRNSNVWRMLPSSIRSEITRCVEWKKKKIGFVSEVVEAVEKEEKQMVKQHRLQEISIEMEDLCGRTDALLKELAGIELRKKQLTREMLEL